MKRICVIWLSIMLTFGSAFILIDVGEDTEGKAIIYNGVTYIPHAPIRIDSNSEFDAAHGVVNWATGNGTIWNPWIIDDWDINGNGFGYCIYIGNTTDYFVVRNCYLHDANGNSGEYFWDTGLILYNTQNGTIANNTANSNNRHGIYLGPSSNITILNNTFSWNNWHGIYLGFQSYNNTVKDNIVSVNSRFGIFLLVSSNNTVANNTVFWNSWEGIYLFFSNNNTLLNNTAHTNFFVNGIFLVDSNNNIIANNNATNNSHGIYLSSSNNNTLQNNTANRNNINGIYLESSIRNTIQNNSASYNWYGFHLDSPSSNNTIQNNTVSNNDNGIYLESSSNNTIRNNTVSNNDNGIYLEPSSNNRIYHNNLITNTDQGWDLGNNFWDDSYPSGGNYWSDYTGIDLYHGPDQDQPGSDGIGDTKYANIQGGSNVDEYPLMAPFEYTEHDIPLQEGWNLISLPVRQLNWSIDSVLVSIAGKWDYIQTYNSTDSTWISNNINRPASLNDLEEMNHLRAYWINITEPGVTLTVKGDKFNSTLSIPLTAGWDFIGYPSLVEKSISDSLAGTGYDAVEGFNASAPYHISPLSDSYMMKPGEGYWVHVPADTVWVVDW